MLTLRHRIDEQATHEQEALDRAELLCQRAEELHAEAAAEAEKVMAHAKADAARLLREALTMIDENVARSEAACRRYEINQLAADAARMEAERLLEDARRMRVRMAPSAADDLHLDDADAGVMFDYRVLAELSR
ncbi:MAG TPA: hypothetical protein VKI19_05975 [Acidimicrobiales bacterium]|nr:hypothetical protein [Acidimicrobiales bacterium]